MRKFKRDSPEDHAERLVHISREIGLTLSDKKRKTMLRIMAENRPLMTKPAKPETPKP